jgi:hypothetical protein
MLVGEQPDHEDDLQGGAVRWSRGPLLQALKDAGIDRRGVFVTKGPVNSWWGTP